MRLQAAGLAAALLTALVAAGCGVGAGSGSEHIELTVTQDFGTRLLGRVQSGDLSGEQTVMRVLQRYFRVSTRYGGGFVQSIAGRSGTASRRDWFFYVGGSEAAVGAAQKLVRDGDHVWWDLHDWTAAEQTPGVVGSFPAPFAGARPQIRCAPGLPAACTRVGGRLRGVAGEARAGAATIPVLVAPRLARPLAAGPAASGVYARFAGAELELLDPRGEVVRHLGPGAGLVAATQVGGHLEWLITGTDTAGVSAAAGALDAADLRDRFAVAVAATGARIPLPVDAAR